LTTLYALFELLTALLEYLDLLHGDCTLIAPPKLLRLWFWLWLKCNIAAQPYYWWWPHAYHIETIAPHPTYVFIVWKEDVSLPAMFNPLCSSTNLQLFKRPFAIKVATMKITDDFCYKWKPSRAYHKIDTFCGEQRWMDTKEDIGKSMKYSSMAKGTSQTEATSNSKPVALAMRVWRHQAGS